ncbi:MAG: response regulator [Ramlibacter sp.]
MRSVVIIDDHDIVRFGIETLYQSTDDLNVVGTAATLKEGLELIERAQPDLVVTDMGTGDSEGVATVRQVVAAQSPRPALVLSMHDEMLYGERVLAAGAVGYIMKEKAHAVLLNASRAALAGRTWLSDQLAAVLIRRGLRRLSPAGAAAAPLTERELEVLGELGAGKTTKEIAASLRLSVRTVDIHRATIKRKLGLRTGAELIAYASRGG